VGEQHSANGIAAFALPPAFCAVDDRGQTRPVEHVG
jgi:hypothetical protein